MRYYIICLVILLAGQTHAEDTSSEWESWNELPEDILEFSGETSPEALSRRLDTLIQRDDTDARDLDRLLELWLEHAARSGGDGTIPLQSLIRENGDGEHPLSEPPGQRPERLNELLQNLPANTDNRPGEAGPPAGLPENANPGNDQP